LTQVLCPDLEERPLIFSAQKSYRGNDDEAGAHAGDAAPLDGRILLGGPVSFRMTAGRYPDVEKYLAADEGRYQYHEVHLSLSFKDPDQVPHVRRVVLAVSLGGASGTPQPIAWSMAPDRIESPSGREISFEIRPRVKLAGVEMSVASLGGKADLPRDPYLIALGELGSQPTWELSRTSKPLDGRQRLILVVRSEAGADVTADIEITASTRTAVLRRFRAVPVPLRLTAQL
jgi:hypothetical protein